MHVCRRLTGPKALLDFPIRRRFRLFRGVHRLDSVGSDRRCSAVECANPRDRRRSLRGRENDGAMTLGSCLCYWTVCGSALACGSSDNGMGRIYF